MTKSFAEIKAKLKLVYGAFNELSVLKETGSIRHSGYKNHIMTVELMNRMTMLPECVQDTFDSSDSMQSDETYYPLDVYDHCEI